MYIDREGKPLVVELKKARKLNTREFEDFKRVQSESNVGFIAEGLAVGQYGFKPSPQTFDGTVAIKVDGEELEYYCDIKAKKIPYNGRNHDDIVKGILGVRPSIGIVEKYDGLPIATKINRRVKIDTIAHAQFSFCLLIYAYGEDSAHTLLVHVNPRGLALTPGMYRYLSTATANNIHKALDLLVAMLNYLPRLLRTCSPFNEFADMWMRQFLLMKPENEGMGVTQKLIRQNYEPDYTEFVGNQYFRVVDGELEHATITKWDWPFYVLSDGSRVTYGQVVNDRAEALKAYRAAGYNPALGAGTKRKR